MIFLIAQGSNHLPRIQAFFVGLWTITSGQLLDSWKLVSSFPGLHTPKRTWNVGEVTKSRVFMKKSHPSSLTSSVSAQELRPRLLSLKAQSTYPIASVRVCVCVCEQNQWCLQVIFSRLHNTTDVQDWKGHGQSLIVLIPVAYKIAFNQWSRKNKIVQKNLKNNQHVPAMDSHHFSCQGYRVTVRSFLFSF